MTANTTHNHENYKTVGEWSGRLIFDPNARLENGSVLMEVHNAPEEHADMIGTQVELGWAFQESEKGKELQAYVDFLTTDITFSDEAIRSSEKGRIHPSRLNGLKNVGPLESLAGARPENNIDVVLESGSVKVTEDGKLRIDMQPVQIRGRKRCLAKFLGPSSDKENQYDIQHYNPTTQQFDGEIETITVPKYPKNNRGLEVSTAKDIEKSPVNDYGWYLYGHFDDDESQSFVVEAWEPRRALIVGNLDEVVHGIDDCLNAIPNRIWTGTRYKKGTIETILLDPSATSGVEQPKSDKTSSISDWKEGDRFLVIHLFGGIGGDVVNEENFLGLITGHSALGDATIVTDDFTNELQFRIIYRQVYAHNNGGIISGPNMWSSYCGDLERGWLGLRPISDIVVKLDAVSKTYDFDDGVTVCPLNELIRELSEMGARYRTGDGDGSALVGSAHSCVQDSSQALFAALDETYRKFKENPKIQEWKEANPDSEKTKDMASLLSVHEDLTKYLAPYGVRKDWAETAKGLRGTESQTTFLTLIETIRTWRTVVPRRAHDGLAKVFLRHGAKLWFIRTNQVGGNDPHIIPLAAARAFDYHDNKKDPNIDGKSPLICWG